MCNCYRELDAGSIYFKDQVNLMKQEGLYIHRSVIIIIIIF